MTRSLGKSKLRCFSCSRLILEAGTIVGSGDLERRIFIWDNCSILSRSICKVKLLWCATPMNSDCSIEYLSIWLTSLHLLCHLHVSSIVFKNLRGHFYACNRYTFNSCFIYSGRLSLLGGLLHSVHKVQVHVIVTGKEMSLVDLSVFSIYSLKR